MSNPEKQMAKSNSPAKLNPRLVSVIIPTYNSSKTLAKCLESIRKQTYPFIETIVVDRYSEDNTEEIARQFGAIVMKRGPERSAQKNYGARLANGEFLYFVDSDFVLQPNTIGKCVNASNDFDAVSTINYSIGHSLWGRSIAFKERFLAHDPTIQTAKFIRKKVFLNVGGFDTRLVIAEDLDLYARLLEQKYKVGSADAIEWHTGEPETLRSISKRSFYYGKSVKSYFAKRGAFGVHQVSPFKPGLFFKLVESGSPYLVSLVIVDATRWMASLFGLACSKIPRLT